MKAKENKATAQATTNKTESTKLKEENTMNKTTKTTKTTANEQRLAKAKERNEQRLAKAKERNEQRLATTKEQIKQATANNESIVNQKAVELSQVLRTTKDKDNAQATHILYTIASILSHSKLNKLNAKETTYNATNVELKNDIAKAIDRNGNGTKYETTVEQLNKLYVVKYNKDGKRLIECTDKRRAQEIEKRLVSLANNDGIDIIQDAVLKLWYYIDKAIKKYGIENLTDTILLDTFEKAIPHSKVYRNGEQKPVELWQYRTTNAIKETSIEISRSIEKLKSVKDTEKAYIPIETLIENENGEQETITQYKQASILSVVPTCDINGKIITETANETTEHLIENVLEKANFTRNESYIFKWYFVGNKTKEQILEKLNISATSNYFEKTVANIRRKCAVVLCADTKYTIEDTNRRNNEQKKQKIVCYIAESEQEIATFESIGKASEFLNIDKGNISKCLKGERKTANGYIFKYAE